MGVATPESYGGFRIYSECSVFSAAIVLPVSTFPDGLQALGRWGRMY